MPNPWQAAKARHHFSELVDAAVQGDPQFVKRRDGREVVVVSREYFEKNRPTLRDYLLGPGTGEEGDAFDTAIKQIIAERHGRMTGDDPPDRGK